ncbi:MAG: hypothetical protein ACFHXK_10650 [bacterium]
MKSVGALSIKYAEQFPVLFASELKGYSASEVGEILNTLPDEHLLAVVTHLDAAQLQDIVAGHIISADQLFAASTLDQAAILLARLPKEIALQLVDAVTGKRKRRELLRFLNYPAHTVGAVVSKPTLQYKSTDLVTTVIGDLAKLDDRSEPALLVSDADGKYLGIVSVWRLFPTLSSTVPVNLSMAGLVEEVEPLLAEIDQTTALLNDQWLQRTWVPVVDYQHRLVGICRQAHLAREMPLHDSKPSHGLANSMELFIRQMFHVFLSLFDLLLNRSHKP